MKKKAIVTAESKIQRAILFTLILVALSATAILVPVLLYQYDYLSYNQYFFAANAGIELAFLASVLLYLGFIAPGRRGIVAGLGLGRKGLTARNVAIGLVIFAIIVMFELIVSTAGQVGGVQINSNVDQLFGTAPVWFLAFSCVIAPICEETLFRSFLVPRIGIVVSALVFAALHYGYNSTFGIEIIAAFIFGIIAGYVFKKTNSLYPSIIAHVLVNTLTVLVTFVPGV